MIRKVAFTLIAVAACIAGRAQSVDEIIAKYFENTGGLDKWKNLQTVTMTGKFPTPQGDFPVTIYRKSPNKFKVMLNIQGKEFIPAAYDGAIAWSLNPFQGGTDPVKMDDEQAKEVSDRDLQSEFIDYKTKGHAVTLEGKEEIDGVMCYKVKLEKNKNNPKDDVTEIYYFDSENYVPIMTKSYVRSGPQKGAELQSFMSDYQDAGGLMVPFATETKLNGQTIEKMVIEKYAVNESIDDSVFAFPKK